MGDKVYTTQYTADGQPKGWNDKNNRWQTDTEFYANRLSSQPQINTLAPPDLTKYFNDEARKNAILQWRQKATDLEKANNPSYTVGSYGRIGQLDKFGNAMDNNDKKPYSSTTYNPWEAGANKIQGYDFNTALNNIGAVKVSRQNQPRKNAMQQYITGAIPPGVY